MKHFVLLSMFYDKLYKCTEQDLIKEILNARILEQRRS